MSVEIIIIIIGALSIIVAIGDSIEINGSSLGMINTKLKLILGITGILLTIYGGYTYGAAVNIQGQIEQVAVGDKLEVEYPVKRVQVISPIADDSVSCRILTMGVYPAENEKDLWVLLRPSDDKYYPQSDETNTSYKRNGEWQVITRFGGELGEKFDIIVYEADAAASQFFSSTIQSWKDALDYPGLELEQLPGGAKEVDRISVYLNDNCRGVF